MEEEIEVEEPKKSVFNDLKEKYQEYKERKAHVRNIKRRAYQEEEDIQVKAMAKRKAQDKYSKTKQPTVKLGSFIGGFIPQQPRVSKKTKRLSKPVQRDVGTKVNIFLGGGKSNSPPMKRINKETYSPPKLFSMGGGIPNSESLFGSNKKIKPPRIF